MTGCSSKKKKKSTQSISSPYIPKPINLLKQKRTLCVVYALKCFTTLINKIPLLKIREMKNNVHIVGVQ